MMTVVSTTDTNTLVVIVVLSPVQVVFSNQPRSSEVVKGGNVIVVGVGRVNEGKIYSHGGKHLTVAIPSGASKISGSI